MEASSYQIEYSKIFKAKYALLLNISPDHLERHKNFKKYLNAKLKLFYNQDKEDFAFFNKKNFFIKNELKSKSIKSKIISVEDKLNSNCKKLIKNEYFNNKNNEQNLSFIFAICKKLKINKKNILKIINNFDGLKYRQEIIYKSKKLTIINDSKSTSFSSTVNLINSLNNIFWILGGLPKKGDKFKIINNKKLIIKAFIYGKKKNFFIKNLKNKVPFETSNQLKDAFKNVILKINKIKDKKRLIILFSPCAASFDTFKNFEERGKYFNNLVRKQRIRI